ncbi:MAG: hypothetical protein LBP24_00485, partial [Coriobacteriales bacterium]|nr:hypothetical protein [Coriobacteriales bacterium]
DRRAHGIPLEVARLYLFDDLGVSQRWANKFSEVGIEMVGELIGKTEEDLLRIEGIGSKAIEELKAGLEERDLLHILEAPKDEDETDVSKLIDMVFSPEDSDLFMTGEVPQSYSANPDDDVIGSTLQVRTNHNDASELDELLGQIGLGIEEIGEGAGSAAGDEDADVDIDADVDAADSEDATEDADPTN